MRCYPNSNAFLTHEMFVRKLLVEILAPSSSPSACRHSLLHFPLPAMDLPGRSQASQWIWDLWRRWTQSESRWSHRRQSCSCQWTWPQHRWGDQVTSGEEERLNHSLMECIYEHKCRQFRNEVSFFSTTLYIIVYTSNNTLKLKVDSYTTSKNSVP